MKKNILFICLCFSALVSFSQIQNIFKIPKEENKFVYQDKFIKLFIGDEIFIQVKTINDSIKEFKIVSKIEDLSNTISVSFKFDKFGKNKATILKMNNPFDKELNYKALISTSQNPNFEETSIVPVYPKIFTMEMWPYNIESIILYDFQLKQNQ